MNQGLFFSELSISSLSSLGPYFDYVEINISLHNSSSLSFLNVYAPPIGSSPKDSSTNIFSFSILPSYEEAKAVEFSSFRFHRKRTASSFRFCFHIPVGNYAYWERWGKVHQGGKEIHLLFKQSKLDICPNTIQTE